MWSVKMYREGFAELVMGLPFIVCVAVNNVVWGKRR